MPKTIEEMISKNQIEALKTVDVESLISFKDMETKANAYLFSCLSSSCSDETVKFILDKTYEYFNKKMMDSKEMQSIMQLDDNSSSTTTNNNNNDDDDDDDDDDGLDSDSDNSIILDQMGQLGKDFFNFFWGTIIYKEIEMTASALAFKNHKMQAVDYIKEKTHLLPLHNDFLKTKISREIIFNSITKKYGEGQNAYFASKVGLIERGPRKFNHERERQLLKQLSTLLFFYITPNGSKRPIETEILHIRIKNVSHLVIACNSGDNLGDVFKQMKNTADLKALLNQKIDIKNDPEANYRVDRYQRIFNKILSKEENIGYSKTKEETPYDIDQYKHIIAVLKGSTTTIQCVDNFQNDDNVKRIEDIKKIFNSKKSMIIILDNEKGGAKERNCHAEEYLVDFILAIRSYKASVGSHKSIYTSISGKKRPCFPCYSTMLNQYVDNHGKRPGYAWKASLKCQKDNDAKITILSLMGMSSHVSLNHKGNFDSSYDSGSDDDEINKQKDVYKLQLESSNWQQNNNGSSSSSSNSLATNRMNPLYNQPQLPQGLILGQAVADGDCLFDAVAQLINDGRSRQAMRQVAVNYMQNNAAKFSAFFVDDAGLTARIAHMEGTLNHADDIEISALALALNRQFIVISNGCPMPPIGDTAHPVLFLHHQFIDINGGQCGHYQPIRIAAGADVDDIMRQVIQQRDQATVTRTPIVTNYLHTTNGASSSSSASNRIPDGIIIDGLKVTSNLTQLADNLENPVRELFNQYAQHSNVRSEKVERNEQQEIIALTFEDETILQEMKLTLMQLHTKQSGQQQFRY